MEVGAAMEKAGSSKEEIEEMMAMIMNKDGGISQEFLDNVRKAMESGSKSMTLIYTFCTCFIIAQLLSFGFDLFATKGHCSDFSRRNGPLNTLVD